jgi:hypothetical protein
MPGTIPEATFRLEHSFNAKPDLAVDQGPENGILVGAHARGGYEALYVGKHAESPFRNVWIDTRGAHALYVMGKRRSGKSYTLGALAEGLAGSGWIRQGSLQQGVLILDTMNVYLTMPFGVNATYDSANEAVKDLGKWKLSAEQPPMSLFRPRGTQLPTAIPNGVVSSRRTPSPIPSVTSSLSSTQRLPTTATPIVEMGRSFLPILHSCSAIY